MHARFSGLYIATLTPFDPSNRPDQGALHALVSFLSEAGADGLCPCGTTGEFLYLSAGEKVRIVETTVRAAAGRCPVLAGVWALTEREASLLARAAEEVGADGVFLPPPIYYPASQEQIAAWYRAVRSQTRLPVFAYNIPACAVNEVKTETVAALAGEGTLAGIKDSTGKEERMKALVETLGASHTVFAASDAFASRSREIGAHGFISALGNIVPASMKAIWEGDSALQTSVAALRDAVKECGGIPAIKEISRLRGLDLGASRLPCSEISQEAKARLAEAWWAAKEQGLS